MFPRGHTSIVGLCGFILESRLLGMLMFMSDMSRLASSRRSLQ